jgi:hypothetical protein
MLKLATGSLQQLKSGVNGGVPIAAVGVEVGESALPPCLVVIKAASELHLRLLDLIENHLDLGIHGSKGSLEAGVVLVGWINR